MANLPIELWHSIFDCLELVDLSACLLISKKFNFFVKEYRIREIAFTGRVYEWFHYTTPIIDHKHRVDYSMASILERSFFNFDYLKRLKIGRASAIDLDVINKFTRLEELDIDLKNYVSLKNYLNEESRTLSLANLKVLYLFVLDYFPYVKLDTPRLAKVYTFDLKKLEFVYPESVRCIHTFYHSGKLSMFSNLEYLTFTDSYNELDYFTSHRSQKLETFNVTSLNKLKEIEFKGYVFGYERKNMNDFREIIENLLAMGRPDLKVFWLDVQMTDINLLIEYERTMEDIGSRFFFQFQHYEKLKEKVDFIWSLSFNGTMSKLSRAGFNLRSQEFISKLFTRFSFREIDVTGQVEERELLLELIMRSPNLFSLNFRDSDLGQSFFDRMAKTVQLNAIPLQRLRLNGANNILSFEFLFRLRHLELFETDQQLPTEFVPKLLGNLKLTKLKYSSATKVNRSPVVEYKMTPKPKRKALRCSLM